MKLLLHVVFLIVSLSVVNAEDRRPNIDAISKVLLEQQIWLGNSIGITDKIPSPWEPIHIQKSGRKEISVMTLGREYKFDKSFWPSTITAWDNQLLSDTVTVKVVLSDGKERTFGTDDIRIVKKTPAEVSLMSFGQVEGISLIASTRIEYDGMIWTDLTINPESVPFKVKKMFLDIPIKKSYAKYIATNLGLLMKPLPINSEFINDIWFGNEQVGLSWFAESDKGWDRSGNLNSQMEVIERDDSLILRLNFIRNPQLIGSCRQISFGILATPSKQLKKNWRTMASLFPPTFADFNWDWGSYYAEPKPELIQSGELFEYIKSDCYFKTSCNYFGRTFRDGTVIPEYYLFDSIWRSFGVAEKSKLTTPQLAEVNYFNKETSLNVQVGNANSSQADWLIWKWSNLVDKYGIKRVYFDSLGAPDINRLHGSGYVDENGEIRPTVPILAMRKFLQRFYIMMSEKTDDFTIMLHGASSIPPMLSFAHAHLSGEQFIVPPRRIETHYTEIVPLDEWIGFFSGKQLGVVGAFLPEFTPRNSAFAEPTEEMMMLTLLHDIPVVSAFCSSSTVIKTQRSLSEYGMGGLEFIPYWDSSAYLKCKNENVKISLYKDAAGKKAILVIGNLGRTHETVSVTFNKSLISGNNLEIKDLVNKEAFNQKDNSLDLVVKELNFRLIGIRAE